MQTDLNTELPTRESLDQWNPQLIHRGKSMMQCDVYILEKNGLKLILKDSSKKSALLRWVALGPLKRENRFLKKLYDLPCTPKSYGWLDNHAILMQCLDAEEIPRKVKGEIPVDFFDTLAAAVDSLHQSGVVHGDMRRKNILWDKQQNPYLIDFATAWDKSTFFGRFMFNRLQKIDSLKVLRMKEQYQPVSITEEEKIRLDNLPLSLKIAHFFKKKIYRHIKQKRWEERFKKK